jgi:hypothetical protein
MHGVGGISKGNRGVHTGEINAGAAQYHGVRCGEDIGVAFNGKREAVIPAHTGFHDLASLGSIWPFHFLGVQRGIPVVGE